MSCTATWRPVRSAGANSPNSGGHRAVPGRESGRAEVKLPQGFAERVAARAVLPRPVRVWTRWTAAAAAALLVIGVGLGYSVHRQMAAVPDRAAAVKMDSISLQSPTMGVEIAGDRFELHSRGGKGRRRLISRSKSPVRALALAVLLLLPLTLLAQESRMQREASPSGPARPWETRSPPTETSSSAAGSRAPSSW